jgi:hypothetical protein
MPLADGDAALDGDIWYRILTHKDYITRGRVQHGALRGRTIKPPAAEKSRPWNAELSGRLRSLAGTIDDVRTQAHQYCAEVNREFHGLMFQKEDLRGQVVENITLGVYYTPIDGGDQAHSDLTFKGAVPFVERSEEHDRFIIALSKKFHGLHIDQVDLLPNANVAAQSAPISQQPNDG